MLLSMILAVLAAEINLGVLAAPVGVGLIIIGAGLGIGKIGASSVEAIARQPEAANNIRMTMIISAALIEGVALFGAVICFLAL